ncbi:MAG: hypothetical protein AB7T63_12085 [Planctomycetota bacterium]
MYLRWAALSRESGKLEAAMGYLWAAVRLGSEAQDLPVPARESMGRPNLKKWLPIIQRQGAELATQLTTSRSRRGRADLELALAILSESELLREACIDALGSDTPSNDAESSSASADGS